MSVQSWAIRYGEAKLVRGKGKQWLYPSARLSLMNERALDEIQSRQPHFTLHSSQKEVRIMAAKFFPLPPEHVQLYFSMVTIFFF